MISSESVERLLTTISWHDIDPLEGLSRRWGRLGRGSRGRFRQRGQPRRKGQRERVGGGEGVPGRGVAEAHGEQERRQAAQHREGRRQTPRPGNEAWGASEE